MVSIKLVLIFGQPSLGYEKDSSCGRYGWLSPRLIIQENSCKPTANRSCFLSEPRIVHFNYVSNYMQMLKEVFVVTLVCH